MSSVQSEGLKPPTIEDLDAPTSNPNGNDDVARALRGQGFEKMLKKEHKEAEKLFNKSDSAVKIDAWNNKINKIRTDISSWRKNFEPPFEKIKNEWKQEIN